MDFAERYNAVASRDTRFDGQFVTAVRTTGIYCRPSCPARTPRPTNVEFFATSAAAHLAGYRACRRCLPEATPGSPQWNLREDVAARAMRLIADGLVDREGVGGLAARLGYSERQLNRVLVAELGAGPLALARAHRAQAARQLLAATSMPVTDVAFAAGFASVRQFNDTVREVFGLTPTQVRATGRRRERVETGPGRVRIVLAHRRPIDTAGLFAWFAERVLPGVEDATEGYARALPVGDRRATVRLVEQGERLVADLRVETLADLPTVIARVRRLLDLDADPVAVDERLASDARLAALVRARPGIRIPGAVDLGEILVRAMVGQQISVAAAQRQLERLVATLGEPLPPDLVDGGVTHRFPPMAAIADRGDEALTGPRARIAAIRAAAAAMASGEVEGDLALTSDELRARLIALKGVGPWTADYVTLRHLGHPDVLVRGDVAIARGARSIGIDPETLAETTTHLAPWRSYLSLHLWGAATGKDAR